MHPTTRVVAALVCAALGPACHFDFDDDLDAPPRDPPRPRHPIGDVVVEWHNPADADDTIELIVNAPAAIDRFVAQPSICNNTSGFGNDELSEVSFRGRFLALARPTGIWGGDCFDVVDEIQLRPGDVIEVTVANDEGDRLVFDATLPPFDESLPTTHQSISAWRTDDGTTWSATPELGLIGIGHEGVRRYGGVHSNEPWDAEALEPQAALVMALEPDPWSPRAMWLASAATGISWFDPGPQLLLDRDDTWIHGQPIDPHLPMAGELSQTAIAIAPDPRRRDTAWVATLNGVFHVLKTDEGLVFTRIANGAALAIAVDDAGVVWAGFSAQTDLLVDAPQVEGEPHVKVRLPPPDGALLRLNPGDDPVDPNDDVETWAMQGEDAVTAILPTANGAWIGTPYGLERATFDAGVITLDAGPVVIPQLAIVDLEPTNDGFWIAARSECEVDHGRLLRVTLDGEDFLAIADYSDMGFGERDFNAVRALPEGGVLVSTLVLGLAPYVADVQTASGCPLPDMKTRTADLYELGLDGGPPRRFGAR